MKKLIVPGVALILFSLCPANTVKDTRQPAVAGAFYSDNAHELLQTVNRHLNDAVVPEIDGRIIALIVPHAGLVYSGAIAAHGYKLLENSEYKNVILVGPSHRYRFEGVSVYGPEIAWETPLGTIPCNNELSSRLLQFHEMINEIPDAHSQEHCLEVQLPYLQTVIDDLAIVPMVMGRPDHETVQILSDALASISLDESTVMVASTDWQHYMSAAEGWPYDSLGLDCIKKLDPDRLEKYLAGEKTQACGGASAVAVMKAAMAHDADKVKILKYGDSGDVSGDKSSVVSYIAAVLYKSDETVESSSKTEEPELPSKMVLTEADKTIMLLIARETIKSYLTTGTTPSFEVSDNLKQDGACFVTLNKHGKLRGCIGQTVATQPLYKTISYCAIQAATSDPRFKSVTLDELEEIHIEISVLTPLQKVTSLDEIVVGRDGLMIFKGMNRGLLLPQVATDYGWDRTEFLENTCRKANLFPNAYKEADAEIFKFQAIIFGE
jgi:AmmeMemoRadiSam system protein B/AmmeMemoRadiSam system protein A